MRFAALTVLSLAFLAAAPAAAQEQPAPLRVELNSVETLQNRCRLSFVVENKGAAAVETFKLDLAVFNPEGVVQRRMVVELGPVRRAKTMVKAFELEGECGQIGAILVNDVTACAPIDPAACLDQLALSSRAKAVRLFK